MTFNPQSCGSSNSKTYTYLWNFSQTVVLICVNQIHLFLLVQSASVPTASVFVLNADIVVLCHYDMKECFLFSFHENLANILVHFENLYFAFILDARGEAFPFQVVSADNCIQ